MTYQIQFLRGLGTHGFLEIAMNQNLKLIIELIPHSSWNNNLRSILKPKMWNDVRKKVYIKCNYRCIVCGGGGKLHAHEVWKYDDENHIQSLFDIVALCSKCHAVKHFGHAGIQASQGKLNYENLVRHFMKINNCNRETFEKHRDESFKQFEERSRYEWTLELTRYKNKIINF